MNPKGQHLFEIYTRLSYIRVASYTSHTLPCLNTKQVTVYPSHFKMQDSAEIRNALDEALIEDNSYSIVKINNDV